MTDPPRSPCGSKYRYVLYNGRCKTSKGASHFTLSEDCDQLQRVESCQPGRCLYASVSQERRNLLELRESPFTPHSQRSFAWHSRSSASISVHSAGVFKSAAGNSSIPIGQPAYLRSIRQSEQLNGVELLELVVMSTILVCTNRQPDTAVFRLDNQPV